MVVCCVIPGTIPAAELIPIVVADDVDRGDVPVVGPGVMPVRDGGPRIESPYAHVMLAVTGSAWGFMEVVKAPKDAVE